MLIWILYFSCLPAIASNPPSLDKLIAQLWHVDSARVLTTDEPEFKFFKSGPDTWMIGMQQSYRIHASVKKVSALLSNPKSYLGLFNGLKEAKIMDRKSKYKYSIFTETTFPYPFMKPDRTSMRYELKLKNGRALYRVSLDTSTSLSSYSGLLFLAPLKGGDSLFYKIDFFEPNLGLVKLLGQEKIWSESAVVTLQADRAIKYRLEHADWDLKKVNQESNKDLDASRMAYRDLYNSREDFDANKALPTLAPLKTKKTRKQKSPR